MIPSHDASTRPPTKLAFHASRIVIDVGVLMVLGAMSLPFVTAGGFQQRAMAADALPALLLLLPIFAITLLPDQTGPIPAPLGWLSLLLAVPALPYAVVKYLDAATLAGTLRGSVGMGARILVFGAFVTVAGIAMGLARNPLHLPVATASPARAVRAPAGAPPTGGRSPAPGEFPRPHPARVSRRDDPPQLRATPPPDRHAGDPVLAPAPGRPQARPPLPPGQADPSTDPTNPPQKAVRPWWPDDLDDLFS